MKKIEKEYTRVEKEIYYEAYDGERFSTPEACKEYENNAKGVIGKKVQSFLVKRTNMCRVFDPIVWCSEDEAAEIYLPQSEKDIDALNMYTNMYYKDCKLLDETYIGNYVVVEFDYNKDWCQARTFDEIIDAFKEHIKKLTSEETKTN